MSENIQLSVARLRYQVPAAEHRIDDALIAVSSLMTSVVTARRDTPGVPAIRGHATIQRLAKILKARWSARAAMCCASTATSRTSRKRPQGSTSMNVPSGRLPVRTGQPRRRDCDEGRPHGERRQ